MTVPFLSFFPACLLSLLSAGHIFSGCRKMLGVNVEQRLEMGPWSIIGIHGHFTTIFLAPKLLTLCSNLLVRMPLISRNDSCARRSIVALLSAYQECLVTFKSMTSQVVQRVQPLSGQIWPPGRQNYSRMLLSFATCTCSAQRGIIMVKLSFQISDCPRQWIGGCQSNGLMCEVNPKV